jgi:hypothetical protein
MVMVGGRKARNASKANDASKANASRTGSVASRLAGAGSRSWPAGQGRRALQGLVALVVMVVPFMVDIPSAFAGVGFGVTPTFPANVTVGQTGLPASLQIVNNSTSPENVGNAQLDMITLVPSCGAFAFTATGDCPNPPDADPGVFQLSSTATGEAGTACAGQTFTVTVIDPATGQVQFVPVGGPVVLGPPGSATEK